MSSLARSPVSSCVRTLFILFLSNLIGPRHLHSPGADAKHPTIRIAAILPRLEESNDWMFAMERVSPAIKIALEDVNGGDVGTGFTLSVEYRDGRCDISESLNHAIEYYVNHEVDVFFGPCCDWPAAPIARQTRFWNIPMLTAGTMAGDFGFEKQSLYPMLTRVGPNINSMASFVVDLMRQHDWKKVKLLYDSEAQSDIVSKLCHLVATGIYGTLLNFNVANPESYIKHDNFKLTKPFVDEDFKDEIGFNYAVVILCASPDAVREIMIKATDLHFDNGEYVFFNIDLFSSKAKLEKPWHRPNDTDERNAKARKAYEALMTVTLRKPDSDEYRLFSDEVKRRGREEYGDQTIYGEEEVNSFVGAFYDAVILYALALNETLEAGYNSSNGREITHRMWNRTFQGITGTVSIDENGDRNADYSLLDLNVETNVFEVVANYYGNRKQYEPVPDKRIHWAAGVDQPPPDTPICGFDGSKCPPEEPFPAYGFVIIILGTLLFIVSLAAFFAYRHYRMEAELAEVNWRVRWDDIMFGAPEKRKLERSGSRLSLIKRSSLTSNFSVDTIACALSNVGAKQIFTKTGSYKV